MNRYRSQQQWERIKPGAYRGPDGHMAVNRGPAWVLFSPHEPPRSFLALADCQEYVAECDRLREVEARRRPGK